MKSKTGNKKRPVDSSSSSSDSSVSSSDEAAARIKAAELKRAKKKMAKSRSNSKKNITETEPAEEALPAVPVRANKFPKAAATSSSSSDSDPDPDPSPTAENVDDSSKDDEVVEEALAPALENNDDEITAPVNSSQVEPAKEHSQTNNSSWQQSNHRQTPPAKYQNKRHSFTRIAVDPSKRYYQPEERESWGPNVKGKKFRKEKGKKKRCPNAGQRIDGEVRSIRFN